MSDGYIVENCSPTLAGIKTGNLVTVKVRDKRKLYGEIRKLNKTLTSKGLRAVPVRQTDGYALIYLYRPDYLAKDISKPDVSEILRNKGYTCDNADICVMQLIEHLSKDSCFPHEIGLFLGYPVADVKGFMEDSRKGVKLVGYWKVYGDKEKAKRTFNDYRRCTDYYRKAVRSGKSLEQLIR